VAQDPNRVDPDGPHRRVNPGGQADRHLKQHRPRTQPPGKIKIVYERKALPSKQIVDGSIDQAADRRPQAEAEHASAEPDGARFKQKDKSFLILRRGEFPLLTIAEL